ncbi:hypothetical protein NECID01_1395 [Nematocida sp. AWRm77]|nr:hypothetical protein NECID01_1395 [Nematocida sp. AWRm77]
MDYEKHTSLEKRIMSYKKHAGISPPPADLALAGFCKDTDDQEDDAVICVFCAKPLVGWGDSDSPLEEHVDHSPKCLLFSVYRTKARERTFQYGKHPFSKTAIRHLTTAGMCLYNLTRHTSDVFCCFCGFFYSLPNGMESSTMYTKILEQHTKESKCQERVLRYGRMQQITLEDLSALFFFELLSGRALREKDGHSKKLLCHTVKEDALVEEERTVALDYLPKDSGRAESSLPRASAKKRAPAEKAPGERPEEIGSSEASENDETGENGETSKAGGTKKKKISFKETENAGQILVQETESNDVMSEICSFLSDKEKSFSLKDSMYIGLERITGHFKEIIDQKIKDTKASLAHIESEVNI